MSWVRLFVETTMHGDNNNYGLSGLSGVQPCSHTATVQRGWWIHHLLTCQMRANSHTLCGPSRLIIALSLLLVPRRRSQRCVVALLSGPEFCWSRSAIPLCQFCILTWGSIPPWIYTASMLAEVGQLDKDNASRIQRQQQRAVHRVGHTTCQAAAMHRRRGRSPAESPTHLRLAQLLSSSRPLAVCHRQHFGGCAGK